MIPCTQEAYDLLHEGVQALAVVEATGMRIDERYLRRAIRRSEKQIKRMQANLEKSEVAKQWRERFGENTNLHSYEQLGTVLFDVMKLPAPGRTASNRFKTDEDSLGQVGLPFVQEYLTMKRLSKASGTYLKGILREVVDGLMHPFFNLHTAITYRSSSEAFNFQNIPIRNDEIANLIRRAFLPRPGRHMVEVDYSGIEVRGAACYHKDPRMLEYILDPTKDMHRDMAMECYRLTQSELGDTKTDPGWSTRFCGKNMFVFPQFYGDWYIDCAKTLWNAIDTMHLTTSDGLPMKAHLAKLGIHRLGDLNPKADPASGTFEAHIRAVERTFWEKRFPVYNQWKKDWYKLYLKRGWFQTLTGFTCHGYMKRNEVINYPVQGSAFHCLLWSLIRLVKKELIRHKMKTLIVGQIHDSIVADVPAEELDDFLLLCRRVMTKMLLRHWDWIIVPLEIEAEVAPINAPWAEKVAWKIPT